jgi:ABC-type antimicrobial peptide transport system permease subunit
MALGATTTEIGRLILQETLTLATVGITLGLAGSFVSGRWLSGFLFGVKAHDPMTFGVVALTLLATALLAGYVPMRRATKIAPTQAIRCE